MKKITILLLCNIICNLCFSQITKEWDKSFGTSDTERFTDAILTDDDSFLIAGISEFNEYGTITNYEGEINKNGGLDFLLMKIDLDGNLIWQKSYGGSDDDILQSITKTDDGGYLLGGSSESNISGDKSENSRGNLDYWVVKVDEFGNVLWDKTFGGSGYDAPYTIERTSDGNFFVIGTSVSNISGDKSENNRGTNGDYWVIKINEYGTKIWDKTYGGSISDIPDSSYIRDDNSLIILGTSNSNASSEKSENSRGERDIWMLAIDEDGNKLWDKTYGGASYEFASRFASINSNLIIPSQSNSGNSGDKTLASFGQGDGWVLALDQSGNKIFDLSFGGFFNDGLNDVVASDEQLLFAGSTRSYRSGNIDATSNGQNDIWLVKTDMFGNKIWDVSIGGEGSDFANEILSLGNGQYILIGQSNGGPSGDKTAISYGSNDFWVVKVAEERPFVTTWKTDNPGTSEDNQITISTNTENGYVYDYTVDWGDGTISSGITGDITHTYESIGVYQVSISGTFPSLVQAKEFRSEIIDGEKLLSVDQWGDIEWRSMFNAFKGCKNMEMLAVDTPDLSKVNSMIQMFENCATLIGNVSMNDWDVANVSDMSNMFNGALNFNQNISSWNVSKVTGMTGMFARTNAFNQDIGSWDVGSAIFMGSMFNRAKSFNQDIGSWNISNVTNLNFMFSRGEAFNQDIGSWNVSSVTTMAGMFFLNNAFDQDIGAWDISNVSTMQSMFYEAGLSPENYDKTLIGWHMLSTNETQIPTGIELTGGTSQYCLAEEARQKLIDDFGWTINDAGIAEDCDTKVEGFAELIDATYLQGSGNPSPTGPILRIEEGNRETYLKFDISSFNGPITNAQLTMQVASDPGNGTLEVFVGSNSNWTETGLNGANKPTIVGNAIASIAGVHNVGQTKTWNLDVSTIETGGFLTLIVKHSNGNDVAFASDQTNEAPQLLVTTRVVPEVQRPFITTWKTDNPGDSANNQITIPTFSGETYNYTVDWGDGTIDSGVSGNITHTYAVPNTYTISITGEFPRIYLINGSGENEKIISVEQWGDIKWSSMESAFQYCHNLDVKATDIPNLEMVTSMSGMFTSCDSLIGNSSFGLWDVSNVTDMSFLFSYAEYFNQDIGSWDVSSVTNMNGMFGGLKIFNQDIGTWDVGKVESMINMFASAEAFNQDIGAWDLSSAKNLSQMFLRAGSFNKDIGNWDLSNTEYMGGMFLLAKTFNQDLSSWNVGNVQRMNDMFKEAIAFDQDLSDWNISTVNDMEEMFANAGLSTANYDALLNGWSTQQLQNGVAFDGGNSQYCLGEEARQKLIDDFGWVITDGGKAEDCDVVEQLPFITTWITDNPGVSEDNQITIHTSRSNLVGPYDFTVAWGDGTLDTGVTGDITHTYDTPGIYEISISGKFPAISFGIINGEQKDNLKLFKVNQWGSQKWSNLSGAFDGCTNLDVIALDTPDLSEVNFLGHMFRGCQSLVFNDAINNWDVSNVTHMWSMFNSCSAFNQDISNWDVGNVVRMDGMFAFSVFNRDIGGWNVEQVTNMEHLFYDSSFNQDISDWNVAKVTSMANMFGLTDFNEDISGWDVGNVTSMGGMFRQNSSFNQDIGNWDTGNVTMMAEMFEQASSFNQNISRWNVSNVNNMFWMFKSANSFNQDLGNWNVGNVTDMTDMFEDVTLSIENYDSLLEGWSTQQLQNGVTFHGGNSQYCLGEEARQKLIDDFGWTITDGGQAEECAPEKRPFITTWKTDNPGISNDNEITIPTSASYLGYSYDYIVDWGDGNIDEGVNGNITHTYDEPGTYEIRINGNFPHIDFGSGGDNEKIILINQWGDLEWSSMLSSFWYCPNLNLVAEDVPDFSGVTSLTNMFAGCTSLVANSSMEQWETSTITEMASTFIGASQFNVDIGGWDVSNVSQMAGMLGGASSFNQDIGGWDVAKVENMQGMLRSAITFNQDISSWDVGNVTNMSRMLSYTYAFNQDIGNWDVSNVQIMDGLFEFATSFDQNLDAWQIGAVTDFNEILLGVTLKTENYDAMLNGWSTQQLQNGVTFDGGNSQYCLGEEARQKLIDDFGWTIADGGKSSDCTNPDAFITTWKTDNPGTNENEIMIGTATLETYNYTVNWGDGNIDSGVTGLIKHTYAIPGTYTVSITGQYPAIFLNSFSSRERLLSVDQWGSSKWSTMELAFKGCTNLDVLATDIPDLSNVTSLRSMFWGCTNLKGNSSFAQWDLSNVTNISNMFSNTGFNQPIESWNVSNVTDMGFVFNESSFNQDIGNWDVSKVREFSGMFQKSPFNQDIGSWDVSQATGMYGMFAGNTAFNQDISNWNFQNVNSFFAMFRDANSFDQDIGNWNVTNVTIMTDMFTGAALSEANYDKLLKGWSTQELQNGVTFDGGNSQYCLAEEARQKLIDDFGWTITDGGKADSCDIVVEGIADLVDATYLQGFGNPSPTGPILRVEEGNRETYLKFDMSSFSGPITEATLQMQVASDPGNGDLEVFLGSDSDWTETGLNGGNKPSAVGSPLANVSGTHSLGQTKTWNLDVSNIVGGDKITLIIKHSNGNDVAFASDETLKAPQLLITSINEPEVQRPFITTWKTDNLGVSEDNQITIPTFPGEIYNYTVDWGDGTSNAGVSGDITHNYANPGIYTVSISGLFPRIVFGVFGIPNAPNLDSDSKKIISIDQWGSNVWGSMAYAFTSCTNLDVHATDIPNLKNVSNASFMFSDCHSLTGNNSMNNWDTSSFVDISYMFSSAEIFNQNIDQWETSRVTNMEEMFASTIFNRDIGSWNTSKVTNMEEMFERSSFNQDISNWDVSNVENMTEMFQIGSFNQDLSSWRITSAKIMTNMFNYSGLSNENYDTILTSWSELTELQSGVQFGALTNQYCLGEAARQKLIDDFGWTITDEGKAENCNIPMEGVADLIDATYLQGFGNPEPTGPILRTEEGNRETYLKFDLSSFSGAITNAQLTMQVASDPGNGTLEVFLASDSNWSETGLNGGNKPSVVGAAIASVSGTHGLGQTKTWNLDVSNLIGGGEITLIVKHSNGNDVAFASDETNQAPQLTIISGGSGLSNKSANTLSLSPNPASYETNITLKEPGELVKVYVYDVLGRMVGSYEGTAIENDSSYVLDVQSLPTGTYYVKSFDEKGNAYQKQMLIKK